MRVMWFLLLVSLIPLANSDFCNTIPEEEPACCKDSKSFSCLQKLEDKSCKCVAFEEQGGFKSIATCKWNSYYKKFDKTNAKIFPCQGFLKHCPYDPANRDPILCAPRVGDIVDYPPRNLNKPGGYCALKIKGVPVNETETEFYKTFLTCWAFDCGTRLRKSRSTTLSEKWNKESNNNWCFPPSNGLEFATNYCDKDVVDKRMVNGVVDETCLLLPFCDSKVFNATKKRQIDRNFFMYPLKNATKTGEVDPTNCQLLCPAETNNGEWGNERCVTRPPCLKDHAPAVDAAANSNSTNVASETTVEPNKDSKDTSDPMEVGQEYCLPWCSYNIKFPSDEDYRKSGKRANNCINRPICTADGELPDREVNIHNSEYCVPIRKCKDNSETYFCEGVEESDEEPKPLSSGLGIGAISGIVVGCLVVVAAIGAFVYWFFFFRKRHNEDEENPENAKKNGFEGSKKGTEGNSGKKEKDGKEGKQDVQEVRKKKNLAKPIVLFQVHY